ncbi:MULTISPECIES: arsenate reductase [unclassified Sphingomonas]|uniref:ArsC family reductase n=1 Tax=unclassified Sphingomonas TaxID=196159 RepID=UPI000BD41DDC|nr:MAG: ArsC family reductase [Sphingomonas sp. 12-62-6]OYX40193.1 MAG: ArsC family reductase [Sphingomonas sp. 32-62-10]
MAVTIYGIKNCDTMKKARAWLDTAGISYQFHDYKANGVDAGLLRRWVDEAGWETVLNRAGTTFRALPDIHKQGIDADRAITLMLAHPSMIKRPVLVDGARLLIGFKPDAYSAFFR